MKPTPRSSASGRRATTTSTPSATTPKAAATSGQTARRPTSASPPAATSPPPGTTVYGNVVVRGSYSNSGNTISGNVLAGSANINTPTISGTLTTVGNTHLTGGGSVTGGVFYGGTYTGLGYITRTAVSPASISYPFDFDEVATHLNTLADGIAALPQTPGVTVTGGAGNQLKLTGTGQSEYLFRITTSQLANMNDFVIDVSGSIGTPTVVIDVTDTTGGSLGIHNNGVTLNGVNEQHLLFNFSSTTSITTNGIGFRGTLLAPEAAVNFTGSLNGGLIANSLSGPGEAHAYKFLGTVPTVVPEPAAMATLALAGLMAVGRRRRTAK